MYFFIKCFLLSCKARIDMSLHHMKSSFVQITWGLPPLS